MVINSAVTLLNQSNPLIEQQLFKKSADGMVGLGSKSLNTLTGYNSNVAIKKSNVKKLSIAKAAEANTTYWAVAPEITTNADAQDKLDRKNTALPVSNRRQGGNRSVDHGDRGKPHHKPHPQDYRRIGFQSGRPIRAPPATQRSHQQRQTAIGHSDQTDDGGHDDDLI